MSQGEWSMRKHLEVLEKVRRREPGRTAEVAGDRICAAQPVADHGTETVSLVSRQPAAMRTGR